jgi:hypothetical protein
MKSVKILMMAAAVLAAPCAQAGSVVLKAQIPFDFVVADRQLPSGEYRILQDHRVVKIYSKSGEQVAIAHWLPQTTDNHGSWQLVFHTYGSQRFLKVIARSDGSGAYLPDRPLERKARAGRAIPVFVATTMQ